MSELMNMKDARRAMRNHIGGLAAKKGVGSKAPFPVRSAKELSVKWRAALDDLDCDFKPKYYQFEDVKAGTLVTGYYEFTAPNGETMEFVGVAGPLDDSDKAVGKCSTYTWKDAIVKGFNIPDDEMVDQDDDDKPRVTPVFLMKQEIAGVVKSPTALDEMRALKERIQAMEPRDQATLAPVFQAKVAELKK